MEGASHSLLKDTKFNSINLTHTHMYVYIYICVCVCMYIRVYIICILLFHLCVYCHILAFSVYSQLTTYALNKSNTNTLRILSCRGVHFGNSSHSQKALAMIRSAILISKIITEI